MLTDYIYPKLPVFFQNIGCCYYGWRKAKNLYGPHFHTLLNDILISEKWCRSKIDAYQNEKLYKLITHAYKHVQYYRKTMRQLGLSPEDIRTRDDLYKLPVLTKEDVRLNLHDLISDTAKKKNLLVNRTSGTTGKALMLYTNRYAETFLSAVWWRHRMRYDLHFKDWYVNFTGKIVVHQNQKNPPYWRWNYPMRQVLISNQRITPDTIRDIIKYLNKNDFKFYVGYPSVIHALASTANRCGVTLKNQPRVILLSAENVTQFQLQDIKKFTSATISEHYGSVEGCGSASFCKHNVFHEDFEYGLLECGDPEVQEDRSVRGKIICTGFANFDFPLIRYEIGDIGTWAPDDLRCSCGLQSKVIMSIDGRLDDYILTPEGRKTKDLDYVFQNTENVQDAQIIQYKSTEMIVNIVQRNGYEKRDEDLIREGVRRWISPLIKVRFDYVRQIDKEPNGKQRFVKSFISMKSMSTLL